MSLGTTSIPTHHPQDRKLARLNSSTTSATYFGSIAKLPETSQTSRHFSTGVSLGQSELNHILYPSSSTSSESTAIHTQPHREVPLGKRVEGSRKEEIILESIYPTPPASPELDEQPVILEEPLSPVTCPLSPNQPDSTLLDSSLSQSPSLESLCSPINQTTHHTPSIPIPVLLNTSHSLPHAAPFKLAQSTGILSVLGGNRILQLEGLGNILTRMPYSAASASAPAFTKDQAEEESVEAMIGGEKQPLTINGMPSLQFRGKK
jgi:hypothetical protein